jgi:hypothetical protein
MRHILKRIWNITAKTWLYLFIASSLLCALALRHNNVQMSRLRDAVYVADQKNGDINSSLNNLRKYVYAHMNTNLASGKGDIKPPVQLKYTYQRLYDAKLTQVQAANQQVYLEAQFYCHTHADQNSVTAQNSCIQNYAVTHGVGEANINIPPGLYGFDFASPTWSPDLAGWSLIATTIFGLAFIIKFATSYLMERK